MTTVKRQALAMMKKLSEKATWNDIMHEIYVLKKIDAGVTAADKGQVLLHRVVKKRFLKK
jgi:hypothetical protein